MGSEMCIRDRYSIADMQAFPWAFIAKPLSSSFDGLPRVAAWRERIKNRPAVRAAINLHKHSQSRGTRNATNNTLLYNQGAQHLLGKDR